MSDMLLFDGLGDRYRRISGSLNAMLCWRFAVWFRRWIDALCLELVFMQRSLYAKLRKHSLNSRGIRWRVTAAYDCPLATMGTTSVVPLL